MFWNLEDVAATGIQEAGSLTQHEDPPAPEGLGCKMTRRNTPRSLDRVLTMAERTSPEERVRSRLSLPTCCLAPASLTSSTQMKKMSSIVNSLPQGRTGSEIWL